MGVKKFSYFFIGVRASVQQQMRFAPDFFSIFASSPSVAPVVKTSSINRILQFSGIGVRSSKAFLMFFSRSLPLSVL